MIAWSNLSRKLRTTIQKCAALKTWVCEALRNVRHFLPEMESSSSFPTTSIMYITWVKELKVIQQNEKEENITNKNLTSWIEITDI